MAASKASAQAGGHLRGAILRTLAGGIALTAIYLLIVDWSILVYWVRTVSGGL